MPERETVERAREDAREGKSPSTQAGEFVREEIHHVREGKHGASASQCDRAFEGPPRWGEIGSAERPDVGSQEGRAGCQGGQEPASQDFSQTVSSNFERT
jgi:hypothetical protein